MNDPREEVKDMNGTYTKRGQGKWASQEMIRYHDQQTYIKSMVSVGPYVSY